MTNYEKRLIELAKLIRNSQGDIKRSWTEHLLGYIEALEDFEPTPKRKVKGK